MKKEIKAIFFDIDGTLVDEQKEMSLSTGIALQKLKQKGIKLIIATGRPQQVAYELKSKSPIEFDAWIMVNGQSCVCENQTILDKFISLDKVKKALKYFDDHNIGAVLATNKGTFVNLERDRLSVEMKRVKDTKGYPLIDMSNIDTYNFYQMMPRVHKKEKEREKEVMDILSGCKALRWSDISMDIILEDSGKDKGMDIVLNYYGIDLENTMAFGDGENDIDMLVHAGIGVAMGNCMKGVRKYADYITESVNDDGVYKALKKHNVI